MDKSGPPENRVQADAREPNNSSTENLISVKDLTKSFKNGGVRIDVLQGVHADFHIGETVAIVLIIMRKSSQIIDLS